MPRSGIASDRQLELPLGNHGDESASGTGRDDAPVRQDSLLERVLGADNLRRALRQVLPVNERAPWMRYAGFVESGDPNSSQSIDEIVYGAKD